jgi:ATP-dependent DNA helicase RecG
MATLDTPLADAIGKAYKPLEEAFGLRTVGDLLRHYPRRYLERGQLTDLAELGVGEKVTVMAEVEKSVVKRSRQNPRKSWLEVTIGDGRSTLRLTFFARVPYFEKDLRPGTRGLFSGEVSLYRSIRQLTHPEYQLLEPGADGEDFHEILVAVYPMKTGWKPWFVRNSVEAALRMLDPVPDPLPATLRERHRLVPLTTALHDVHRPRGWPPLRTAQKRLKWDEAMVLQVTLARRRRLAAQDPATPRPLEPAGLVAAFDQRLPFELTGGQRAVGEELSAGLAGAHPMHLLLQGEVGSGKTVVALRGMLQVVDAGGQAALLAPTEVLAQQHARNLRDLLGPLARRGELDFSAGAPPEHATRVALLTGSMPAAARRQALLEAATGDAGIVIGTHALLQEHVEFFDLGLVVVDEQHRFGVEQRDALRAKGKRPPHVLVMTATPIPRTVAMTVFGDLETASLRELPKGRSPISTTVIPVGEKPGWLSRAWQRIREEVAAGHQAFVVCPRIGGPADESDVDGSDVLSDVDEAESEVDGRPPVSVADTLPMLVEGPLQGLRVAALHGRMPAEEKDAAMGGFSAGELDVLVATTVIEVGVDVPNATVMVVLDADRFGVSQLHQLRGRIGRGSAPGLCLLVTDSPDGAKSRERLDAVASTLDGFELARLDLEQRREGDVLGAAQWGRRSSLQQLSLLRDEELIVQARAEATALVADDPDLRTHPLLAAEVAKLTDGRAEYLEKT